MIYKYLQGGNYELAEVTGESKERRLLPDEKPVSVMLLWPLHSEKDYHRYIKNISAASIRSFENR